MVTGMSNGESVLAMLALLASNEPRDYVPVISIWGRRLCSMWVLWG